MSVTTSSSKYALLRARQYASELEAASSEQAYGRSGPASLIKAKRQILSLLLSMVPGLLLLAAWYVGTTVGHINALLLPAPADVFTALSNGISSGLYLSNTVVTIQESVWGFLLAVVIALPLGYALAKSRLLAAAIQPYLSAGQAIPAIVIAPVLIIWLGYGQVPILVLCMLVVLFPMVINTVLGIETIDHALIDAARVEGASGWSLLAHIEFPLALPAVLAAIRSGFTLSITGALVGEFVSGGDQGLGSLVMVGLHQYNTPLLFATLIVLAALATVYYSSTWLLVKWAQAIY
ncbi:MAG TPA: ABC transporter permease [Ktedonobacteraceae bacterium]|nr:ABC transporter permease [Ktedonobacteraceae bacterium]